MILRIVNVHLFGQNLKIFFILELFESWSLYCVLDQNILDILRIMGF